MVAAATGTAAAAEVGEGGPTADGPWPSEGLVGLGGGWKSGKQLCEWASELRERLKLHEPLEPLEVLRSLSMATLEPASQPSSPPPTGFSGCIASKGHAASNAESRKRAEEADTALAASMSEGGKGDVHMLAGVAGPARGVVRGDGGGMGVGAGAGRGEGALRRGDALTVKASRGLTMTPHSDTRRGGAPGPGSLGSVCTPMPPLSCVGGGPRRPSR